MPSLSFRITGVEAANRGLVPLLHFKLEIANHPPNETIQSILLQTQIQIASPQRAYNDEEKAKLRELFGTPEQWGNTLRNKLWAHANTIVPTFSGQITATLPVPCSYDLNIAATKYFYSLGEGEVPLLFLFSGTIFYAGADGRLQVQQVSWNCEANYRMPVARWQELMEQHYPNSAWLTLDRAIFDRLYEFKRSVGAASWEQTVERLLMENEEVRNNRLRRNDEVRNPKSETRTNDEPTEADDDEFWGESSRIQEGPERVYDLEERTARFGEAIIRFAKNVPRSPISDRLIAQLVGCGTSVGANYCEADDAVSRKEFFLRAGTCRKEAREAKHFLRMIATAFPELKESARPLWREAKELNQIFAKICRSQEPSA